MAYVDVNTNAHSKAGGMGGDFIINRGISEDKLIIIAAVVGVIALFLFMRKKGR